MKRVVPRITLVYVVALQILGVFVACRRNQPQARVGIFLYSQQPVIREIHAGFRERLDSLAQDNRPLEYIERNADGDAAQASAIASFFRSSDTALIFVVGLPAAQALKSAGVQQAVVFGGPPDPIGAGLVPRLRDHGTNFTGTRYFPPTDKILGVFAGAFPQANTIAVLHNPGEANSTAVVRAFLSHAAARGLRTRDLAATNAAEIEAALRALAADPVSGLFLPTDNLVYSNLERILAFTRAIGVPVFNCTKLSVERGATFSLATDYHIVGKLSADIASRILFQAIPPSQVDVLDIQEGVLYVNASDPIAGRVDAPAGYARVPIQ